jgi:hypothetical protein
MTSADDAKRDAKFRAACEEYIREAMADGLNREQALAKLEEITKIAFGESIAEGRSSFISLVENQTRNID